MNMDKMVLVKTSDSKALFMEIGEETDLLELLRNRALNVIHFDKDCTHAIYGVVVYGVNEKPTMIVEYPSIRRFETQDEMLDVCTQLYEVYGGTEFVDVLHVSEEDVEE